MQIAAGLVGLPNVGKSTLFNALTRSSVPAENYPFCTIAPHTAVTLVPDPRIPLLQKAYGSTKMIPSSMKFVDIAGLVKGAASGEGLGNQFLSHIREVNLIVHVVRCFDDPTIVRSDELNPIADLAIITTELMLKDLETIKRRHEKVQTSLKASRFSSPQERATYEKERDVLERALAILNDEDIACLQELTQCNSFLEPLLLSTKKYIIVANCGEQDYNAESIAQNIHVKALRQIHGEERVIPLCARLEHELSQLSHEEATEMLKLFDITNLGIDSLIRIAYRELGLITFFTCGPKEIHAWPIPKGTRVRTAAGEIHSDLEKGFICADVWTTHDILTIGNESKLRTEGKIRTEGQDYLVQDGDILSIKFNV
jgi:GTP-binding protein YchF